MKNFIILFTILFMNMAIAAPKAQYEILPGKLHKGGSAFTDVLPNQTSFTVRMGYAIDKKSLAPVPSDLLKGEVIVDLPLQFKDERGYLELETLGTMKLTDGVIKFVKRTTLGNRKDAFEVLVLPKNGKSKIEIIYHPELPSVGWGQAKVTFISGLPLLNGYEVVMKLK
ncbi:MAG: hypothetical protein NDI69_02405 [Bacteriovoracaceae bacterium]|nr:hypothetical protein [Bacteriovoracaceae bacterium]